MSISGNIAKVEERIQKACGAAGRKRGDITLMGVSKFVPVNMIEEAWQSGIRCFGESKIQESLAKFETFREDHPELDLHLIGSLQRNKAKKAVLFFDCIQSVDRLELIGELDKFASMRQAAARQAAARQAAALNVLLELHTGEDSKSGFSGFDELFRAAEIVLSGANLKPQGLMTMAPFTEDARLIRGSFRQLVKAQKELERRFPPAENWTCLSMGMSNDFEIAVEEGSTMLRIGGGIFKEQ
ncbi:MAG: YggS family pyridoxal phosphate-dependent enzyme [Treponema sp.]|jgi:pyridoxal phosphate enzyme (YggS family)|nr:YggS family pyridoxal phosphate-dependent enzyme [Treponema sp.]